MIAVSLPSSLEPIHRDASKCGACPLAKTAHQTVVYRGAEHPVVLFVGQSPGTDEDRVGLPFVGASGRELDAKLAETPFPPYGITNAVLHHPPGNAYRLQYGEACRPFLERVVKALSPRLLVTLGRDAAQSVESLEVDLPTRHLVHPAAMLYSPSMRVEWDNGWRKLRLWLAAEGAGA